MTTRPHTFWTAVCSGARGRCPNCGRGRLFLRYLVQVHACAQCDEPLGHIRADDGPAWLTIVILGHILTPFLLGVVPSLTWPVWQIMLLIVPATLLLTFALLPFSKGIFIAAQWRLEHRAIEK